MAFPTCQHVKPSGKGCGSPALKDREFCYYHSRLEESLPPMRDMYRAYNPQAAPGEWPLLNFPTPELEDAAGIQIGFMQVLHGVANGNLDVRKAGRMLSALHGAAANLQRLESCLSPILNGAPRKLSARVQRAGKSVRKLRARKLPRPSLKKAGTGHPDSVDNVSAAV
jgi:hypothetical protein